MKKGVSIVICCYNSAARLGETLKHVFALQIPEGFQAEVAIINNNSTDDTIKVAIECKHTFSSENIPLFIFDEKKAGHANARKRGIVEASYDLILFCDDDNHLASDYLLRATQIFMGDPMIGIAGGWPKPKLASYPGRWIESNFTALAIESVPKTEGYKEWVFGAGMVVKKRIFTELESKGIKFLLSGRLGSKQTSGDDAEICSLTKFLGYKIYYSPKMILHHKIAANRLTRWSFIKANYRNVMMVYYFYIFDAIIKESDTNPEKVYNAFLKSRFGHMLYFFPRMFFGKNAFFSFMMFFQNIQVFAQLILKRSVFYAIFRAVRDNLLVANGDRK